MMSDAGHVLLSYLSFLAEKEEWRALAELLCEPLEFRKCRLSPVATPVEVFLERLDGRLTNSAGLRNLFRLALLCAHLRFPEQCPPAVASFLDEKDTRASLLPGVNLTGVSTGRWTAAAVMVTLGQEAQIRYFVVGLNSKTDGLVHLPPWAEPLLDDTAKQAIVDAAQAAVRVSNSRRPPEFCCFPLCVPNQSVQVRGRSLGLPLGLAFASLLNGEEPWRVIAATGDLAPDGTVRQVGSIDVKSACLAANPRRFKALLLPAKSEGPCACEGLELLPVSNLEEAIMFAGLYRPGKADLLLQLPAMLRDPARFVSGCRTLDPVWIRWAVAHGKLAGVVERIAASPELFESLLIRLRETLESRDLNLAAAISSVISPDHFRASAEPAPKAAFGWCTQNIALANHTGDISGAADWIRKSDGLVERIWQIDPEAVAEHFNHRIVSAHNRYRFVPEVPSELEGRISLLESQLAVRKQAGIQGFMTLGRLYGTLGQHYAFCGPWHVETALDYFKRARSTLGEGTVPDLKEEWRRQLNYEAFAYLDAGRFEEARQRVCAYLDVSGLDDVRPEALALEPPWKHNLLARLLADTGDEQLRQRYLAWARQRRFAPPKPDHPWQLWAFNVGRIAFALGETEVAATSFKISLELCLKAMPTIKVMALLGLAGLARVNRMPDNLSEIESEVRRVAAEINPDHFADVLKVPFEQVLEQVWCEPGRLFPFAYH
jgi:hypothetical protein